MSYPPQPGQDPNNPYAQQPQQPQQPGYGYPQQGQQQPGYGYPQQAQQPPAYGYPQQDPNAAYGYPQQQGGLPGYGGPAEGYPMGAGYGMMTEMPGPVKTVRIIMFVFGGLASLAAVLILIGAAALGSASSDVTSSSADAAALGAGVLFLMALLTAGNAVYSFLCAVKAKSGGNGWRTATIVLGALSIAGGLFNLMNSMVGLVNIALGVLIIVFMTKAEAKAWYNRPRY